MTTEKTAIVDELPPFSFSKKPIKNLHLTSSISPYISHIVAPDKHAPLKPSLNNINYDEQIRAPRMSLATHYTYEPELPQPFTDRRSDSTQSFQATAHGSEKSEKSNKSTSEADKYFPAITVGISYENKENESVPSSSQESNMTDTLGLTQLNIQPPPPQISDSKLTETYLPATADLNKPTRRSLEPQAPRWGSENNILGDYAPLVNPCDSRPHTEPSELSDGTTTLLVQLKLHRAIENLSNNVTTAERYAALGRSDSDLALHLHKDIRGPAIKQVYHMKKPMCLPAVLRPVSTETGDLSSSKGSDTLGTPKASKSNSSMVEMDSPISAIPQHLSMGLPDEQLSVDLKVEPTHEHWKPNNTTDHCLNCFGEFGGFFNPQRLRRHHCRFCGMLFCQNCLYNNREMHMFEITSPTLDQKKFPSNSDSYKDQASKDSALTGSSIVSHPTSVLFDENADGIMLDSKARFVIPVFRNLPPDGMSDLQQKNKVCKVCKGCGSGYLSLMQLINLRGGIKDDISTGYVFIENPYLKSSKESGSENTSPTKRTAAERRSLLANNLPSDWTWSSF